MGRIVMVGYRPKRGQAERLKTLLGSHVAILRREGLATARQSILMEAGDGTIVEVFEWVSAQAIQAAHSNPAVQRMWSDCEAVCDYVPIGTLVEAQELFSEFTPL